MIESRLKVKPPLRHADILMAQSTRPSRRPLDRVSPTAGSIEQARNDSILGVDHELSASRTGSSDAHRAAVSAFSTGDKSPALTHRRGGTASQWILTQQQQHTGMLFIKTQQVQPAFIIAVIQAQQAWIIAELAGSPLVHVMQTPSSVASHLQWHMVILNEQTVIPFMMQQQLQRPPAIMVQRF